MADLFKLNHSFFPYLTPQYQKALEGIIEKFNNYADEYCGAINSSQKQVAPSLPDMYSLLKESEIEFSANPQKFRYGSRKYANDPENVPETTIECSVISSQVFQTKQKFVSDIRSGFLPVLDKYDASVYSTIYEIISQDEEFGAVKKLFLPGAAFPLSRNTRIKASVLLYPIDADELFINPNNYSPCRIDLNHELFIPRCLGPVEEPHTITVPETGITWKKDYQKFFSLPKI